MKVGDYIRTDYGISKIIGIYLEKTMTFIETDNGLGNYNFSSNGKLRKGIAILEENYRNFIDNNIKKRLIDLIEVGDYVNGYRVLDIAQAPEKVLYLNDISQKCALIPVCDYQIKSIVTKEQFESMEYKVKKAKEMNKYGK